MTALAIITTTFATLAWVVLWRANVWGNAMGWRQDEPETQAQLEFARGYMLVRWAAFGWTAIALLVLGAIVGT